VATNPYLTKEKNTQIAYIDPKTGNMSIIGGGGGDKTEYLKKRGDEFISQGYVPVTDSNIISQLQQGASNTSTFKNTNQWQDLFNQNAGSVAPLSQTEINAAKQRLSAYDTYNNAMASSIQTPADSYAQTITDSHVQTADPYVGAMDEYKTQADALANAQRQSRIAGLGKARDSALSGLDAEKATIDPYYYDKRNQAAAQSDIGAKSFAEYQASRGITGSAGAMPEMYRNAGLQSQIGSLDRQQAAEHSDIARRKSGIESAYQSDVASANADIDAQATQNYINQMQTVEAQRIADLAAQGKTSTGQPTLQGQNAQNSEYERQAALLAAQYYDNIQAKIDELATANPNDPLIPYLYSARQQKIQAQAEQQRRWRSGFSEVRADSQGHDQPGTGLVPWRDR
jgi:hypothetical protein